MRSVVDSTDLGSKAETDMTVRATGVAQASGLQGRDSSRPFLGLIESSARARSKPGRCRNQKRGPNRAETVDGARAPAGSAPQSESIWRCPPQPRPRIARTAVSFESPRVSRREEFMEGWRRGGDSNSRYPHRYSRFRGGRDRPLCHLSARSKSSIAIHGRHPILYGNTVRSAQAEHPACVFGKSREIGRESDSHPHRHLLHSDAALTAFSVWPILPRRPHLLK